MMMSNFYDFQPREIPFGDLTKLLNDQSKLTKLCEEMKGEMVKLRKEVGNLKENVSALSSKVDSKSRCLKNSRMKLPTDLSSARNRSLQCQFNGEEEYNSVYNQGVAAEVVKQISAECKEEYRLDEMKAATHRYYETKRRVYNDSQPRRQAQVKKNRDANQRRGFRKRTFKGIRSKLEEEYWSQINYKYMTEESEDEEHDRVRTHKIPWTSNSLNKLKHKLDARLRAKDLRSGRFKAMERIESTTSVLPPPKHPVKWAVSLTASSSEAVSVESSDTYEQFSSTSFSSEMSPPSAVSDDNSITMPASHNVDSTPNSLQSAELQSMSFAGSTPNRYKSRHCLQVLLYTSTTKCYQSVGAVGALPTSFATSTLNRSLSVMSNSADGVTVPIPSSEIAATNCMPQNRSSHSGDFVVDNLSNSKEEESDWSGPEH